MQNLPAARGHSLKQLKSYKHYFADIAFWVIFKGYCNCVLIGVWIEMLYCSHPCEDLVSIDYSVEPCKRANGKWF